MECSGLFETLIFDDSNMKEMQKLIFDSSSSSSDSEDEIGVYSRRQRIPNYINEVVRSYNLEEFKSHFRMSRAQFEILHTRFACNWRQTGRGRPRCSFEKALLTTIWYLANTETYRQAGDRFNFERGHAQRIILEVCKMIYQARKEYIKWPEGENLRRTIQEFNSLRGSNSFPNVISCIDGTHIIISGSQIDNSYYNRHGQYSIQLQATCNSKMMFTDIYVGWPGSVHDARVWRNSSLYKKLLEERSLPPDVHILGDSAYPISTFLLTPYRDDGHLNSEKKIFNKKLSSTRVVIEQAFGRLKGLFRRLKFLEIKKMENAKYIIMATCIIHNFLIQHIEEDETLEIAEAENIADGSEDNNEAEDRSDNSETMAGNLKRDFLAHMFLSRN